MNILTGGKMFLIVFGLLVSIGTLLTLFLTLLAVIWYAWQTKQLKEESIKQTELSLRPLVMIEWISPGKYTLKNRGNGMALDIRVSEIPVVRLTEEVEITFEFKVIDMLPPGDEAELEILLPDGTSTSKREFATGAIIPHSAVRNFDYTIGYTDINNTKYRSFGKIGMSGAKFEGTKKG